MISGSNIVCIVADDLTGANDTALQFKLNGADTNILLSENIEKTQGEISQAWAISTESRNVPMDEAYEKVKRTVEFLNNTLCPDYYYKKIDSTLRGNIAVEILAMLEVLGWDCAVIMPAFPQEGRITVGGYHLLNCVPIEMTEMACDPHSPITESHIPTLLKQQLGDKYDNLIGQIELKTVLDGAREILIKTNELIEAGKKIIVADSISQTDVAQIVLAMKKSDYKILPVGNAAAAKILANEWFPQEEKFEEQSEVSLPKLPKFIVSGSATQITANQIEFLQNTDEYQDKCHIIELDINTILNGVEDSLVDKIEAYLSDGINVLVHTSNLFKNFDGFADDVANADLTKATMANKITDFLADLTSKVLNCTKAILVTLGGETSYKCCHSIGANQLKLMDEVLPAIAISKNIHHNQLIVTKSGNLGDTDTLVKILKYFEQHEKYYE